MDIFEFLNQFAGSLLGIALPFLAGIAALHFVGVWNGWKLGKYSMQLKIIENVVEYAVDAAEQLGLTKVINDKKAWALQQAEDALAARGVKIDLHELEARIEAEVLRQFPHISRLDQIQTTL